MSTILVPETFMLEMVFVHQSQRMENVYHIRTPGAAPTLADLVSARGLADAWWKDGLANSLRNVTNGGAQLVKIECTSLHEVGGPVHEFVPNPIIGGARPVNTMPSFVTLAVKWGTGKSGRSFRGRTYMVGLGYNPAADGMLTTGEVGGIQSVFGRWLSNVNGAGWELVVASKYSGVEIVNGRRRGIPRLVGITTPITTVSVERVPDTRRSRKIPHLV